MSLNGASITALTRICSEIRCSSYCPQKIWNTRNSLPSKENVQRLRLAYFGARSTSVIENHPHSRCSGRRGYLNWHIIKPSTRVDGSELSIPLMFVHTRQFLELLRLLGIAT